MGCKKRLQKFNLAKPGSADKGGVLILKLNADFSQIVLDSEHSGTDCADWDGFCKKYCKDEAQLFMVCDKMVTNASTSTQKPALVLIHWNGSSSGAKMKMPYAGAFKVL